MSVIEFSHVSKSYRLGVSQTKLREALPGMVMNAIRRRRAEDAETFWALKDVNFEVQPGDVLGIIGHNGAGKSTILKLLSKVTYPTAGCIRTSGRMAALIELGAGFHSDLSGRENIYLNGSILGLKRREIESQFSSIVEFSGISKFIDTPVKRYSSGMYVRLAFAIAVHVRADVLLIDEVLSVGDSAFQQKCLAKMNELHNNGATIVFISHNLWTVQSFCKRAILLRQGQIEAEGQPGDVIEVYRQYERQDLLANNPPPGLDDFPAADAPAPLKPETVISKVELLTEARQVSNAFEAYDRIIVRVHYVSDQRIVAPLLMLRIARADGVLCCVANNRKQAGFSSRIIEGEGHFDVQVGPLPLVPDLYTLEAHIIDSQEPIVHASSDRENFRINGDLAGLNDAGVFVPDVEWL